MKTLWKIWQNSRIIGWAVALLLTIWVSNKVFWFVAWMSALPFSIGLKLAALCVATVGAYLSYLAIRYGLSKLIAKLFFSN